MAILYNSSFTPPQLSKNKERGNVVNGNNAITYFPFIKLGHQHSKSQFHSSPVSLSNTWPTTTDLSSIRRPSLNPNNCRHPSRRPSPHFLPLSLSLPLSQTFHSHFSFAPYFTPPTQSPFGSGLFASLLWFAVIGCGVACFTDHHFVCSPIVVAGCHHRSDVLIYSLYFQGLVSISVSLSLIWIKNCFVVVESCYGFCFYGY